MAKHINSYLAQISITIGKSDTVLGSDQMTIAIKAWTALVQILHHEYDPKLHASCLSAHKQVMQVLFKKVDRTVKVLDAARQAGG